MDRTNHRLVYSTDPSSRCPECHLPSNRCQCGKHPSVNRGDGIVRIRREVKGRKGKTVTSISGIPLDEADLKNLARALKQQAGTGGSVKDGVILIQGDHRERCKQFLEKEGFQVKLAGG